MFENKENLFTTNTVILLGEIQFAYNNTVHSSFGVSPMFLNFAGEPKRTGKTPRDVNNNPTCTTVNHWLERVSRIDDLREKIELSMKKASQKQSKRYNKN